MAYFGTEGSLLPGRGIVTDPKGEKPESDHPHEDDLPLELHQDQEGLPAAGEEDPLDALSLNASTEEFHFSGPAEELDFTEPTDFTFPTRATGGRGRANSRATLPRPNPRRPSSSSGLKRAPPPNRPCRKQPRLSRTGRRRDCRPRSCRGTGRGRKTSPSSSCPPGFERPNGSRSACSPWAPAGRHRLDHLGREPRASHSHLEHRLPRDVGADPLCLMALQARWVTPPASAALYRHAGLEHRGLDYRHVVRWDWNFRATIGSSARPG